jgi:CubicO group peptidase (beta-lactamase class C family)
MKYLISLFTVILLTSLSALCQPNTKKESRADKIGRIMKHYFTIGEFNGTILVSEKGKILYKNAFGISDNSKGTALKIESKFYLGSISKQFTTMAIMMLKEKKKLSYEDKLSKYFPELSPNADIISIKHLMTRTSGMPDYFQLGAYKPDLTNQDVLKLLVKNKKIEFTPGDKFSYSNSGYLLLAMIVEKASETPYFQFMKESIFDPIGMKNTLVYDESKPIFNNRAIGHTENGKLDDYEILTVGDGGIYSTVEDLYKWDQSLYTEKLVSSETINEAFSLTVLNNEKLSYYGYGWFIGSENTVSHGGALSGFLAYMKRDLENKNSYFLLTNYGSAFARRDLIEEIDDVLNNEN